MQCFERRKIDFRERWEWLDGIAQYIERYACANGKCGLLQPFAGFGAKRVSAN